MSGQFNQRGQIPSFNEPNFNTNTSHPLIPNSQEYIYYRKYVSIHSEDRDITKYPSSSEFEIEMPQDMLNIIALRLAEWSFPSNYNTFSCDNNNVTMTFKINNPYNPNEVAGFVPDLLTSKIYDCLLANEADEYKIQISDGFYNPQQLVTELTNRFNTEITCLLNSCFLVRSTSDDLAPGNPVLNAILQQEYKDAIILLKAAGGYKRFVIVYNTVGQKVWFGNICDGFILTNQTTLSNESLDNCLQCANKSRLPNFSDWGLPGNIGLSRCNITSITNEGDCDPCTYCPPRFFYGDVFPGDDGYWLQPDPLLQGSTVYWIESTYKINIMGPAFIYMEVEGQNCIDETSPYNFSEFTSKTNETNGVVNSSFAKIPVPTTPLAQWFDRESLPYKFYYPPAERMRKLKIKLRYHDGQLVNFGVFNYSFVVEFVLQLPQILRNSNTVKHPPRLY
jgi:hypothetical protein